MAMTNEEIKKKMQANSEAWHTADDATKRQLEAENQALGKQIGGTYNEASGTWSDSGGNKLYGTGGTTGGTKTAVTAGTGGSGNKTYTPNGTYTIGSQKGQNIARDMGIGDSYTASDGSVWTKNTDGTITVVHKGVTTDNAYKPTDLSILLQQQMEAGVPYQDVEKTLAARVNKALSTEGLEKYAYDDIYNAAWDYILDGKNAANKENSQADLNAWLENYNQNNAQPNAPKSDPRIDKLLNQILNRDDFSYDAESDPMYQQYAKMYQREGDRAMRNTLAEAASNAGGMNTYAITAAQQAANYYNSQLNDRMPELFQLAYEMYLDDKASMVQDLGLLQDMDATQYARYRDTMADYKDDRNFAYGMYQDAVAQGNYQNEFDYNAMLDNRNFGYDNYWNDKEFDANQEQIAIGNEQWQQQFDANQEQIGIENEQWERAFEEEKEQNSISNKQKQQKLDAETASGNGYEDNGYTGDDAGFELKNVIALNLGVISDARVLELAEAGLVNISDDGYVSWAAGVDETNYKQKLAGRGGSLGALK